MIDVTINLQKSKLLVSEEIRFPLDLTGCPSVH